MCNVVWYNKETSEVTKFVEMLIPLPPLWNVVCSQKPPENCDFNYIKIGPQESVINVFPIPELQNHTVLGLPFVPRNNIIRLGSPF